MNQSTILLLTLQQEYIKYKFNKKKSYRGQYIGTLYNHPLESIWTYKIPRKNYPSLVIEDFGNGSAEMVQLPFTIHAIVSKR